MDNKELLVAIIKGEATKKQIQDIMKIKEVRSCECVKTDSEEYLYYVKFKHTNEIYEVRVIDEATEATKALEEKYPLRIIHNIRQAYGADNEEDTQFDEFLLHKQRGEILNLVAQWEGLNGYGKTIRYWVETIWGFDLDYAREKLYNEDR